MPLLRHYLDVAVLSPTTFDSTLQLLPASAHEAITRYHFPSDRNLALGSALLQRSLICSHYFAYSTLSSVPLHRDPANGRPYHLSLGPPRDGRTRIEDFNATHHNPRLESPNERCIVALAALTSSGPEKMKRKIGIDIVPTRHRRQGAQEFLDTFCGQDHAGVFTALEISTILAYHGLEERIRCLYLFWALKEAYTKALGVGIVMELTRVEFRGVRVFEGSGRWRGASLWVDGCEQTGWYLEVSFLRGKTGGERDGFYIAVCCEREGLEEDDMDGEWEELVWDEIVDAWGGAK